MPEFVEIEAYRRTVEPLVGSQIDRIEVRDERLLRRSEPSFVHGVLDGATIERTRRRGKVLLVDVSSGHTAAFGFGLRGWLALDGQTARADGTWESRTHREDHVRLRMDVGGRVLKLEDQLRMSTVEIDIDEERLGVDVLDLSKQNLADVLSRSHAAVKTVLMDQRRIAGVGNLIADEVFYQAGIDPRRPADDVTGSDLDALWTGLRRTRSRVLEQNGSHHGVMIEQDARRRGGICPRCGVEVERVQVGGRTTYFCPQHQR